MAILGPVEPGRGFDGATEGVRRGNRPGGGDELPSTRSSSICASIATRT